MREASDELRAARASLNLAKVTNDAGILSAAALLERVVNNTSLFFVLDVAGTRLLFPGDAQQGAWDHVLADKQNRALIKDCAFYKVGHHGSHNATPKDFVLNIWQDGAYAMLPWGLVKRWQDSIPKRELMEALRAHKHTVIRINDQHTEPGTVEFHHDLWSQLTIPTQ
jgi:beta-lactamase superfamily II metal-dependent hydrolase